AAPAPTFDNDGHFNGFNRQGLNTSVKLTGYMYDDSGRRVAVFHPDVTATRYEYDSLGALLVTTENADAGLRTKFRQTANVYEGVRPTKIVAILPTHTVTSSEAPLTYAQINFAATDGTLQVTKLTYGADVIWDGSGSPSLNNDWVGNVYLPD